MLGSTIIAKADRGAWQRQAVREKAAAKGRLTEWGPRHF